MAGGCLRVTCAAHIILALTHTVVLASSSAVALMGITGRAVRPLVGCHGLAFGAALPMLVPSSASAAAGRLQAATSAAIAPSHAAMTFPATPGQLALRGGGPGRGAQQQQHPQQPLGRGGRGGRGGGGSGGGRGGRGGKGEEEEEKRTKPTMPTEGGNDWYPYSHLKELTSYYGDPEVLNFTSSESKDPSIPSDIDRFSDDEQVGWKSGSSSVEVNLEDHKRKIKQRLLQVGGSEEENFSMSYASGEAVIGPTSSDGDSSPSSRTDPSASASSSGRGSSGSSGGGMSMSSSSSSGDGASSGGGSSGSSSSGGGSGKGGDGGDGGSGGRGGKSGKGGGGGKGRGKAVAGAGDVDDGGVEWGQPGSGGDSFQGGSMLRGGGEEEDTDSLDLGLVPIEPKKKRGRKTGTAPKKVAAPKKAATRGRKSASKAVKEATGDVAGDIARGGAGDDAQSGESLPASGMAKDASPPPESVGGESADKDTVERASTPPPPGREEALLGFDPVAESTWKPGDDVPFMHLAKALSAIEKTSKRLEIVDILTNALRCILVTSPNDLLPATQILISRVGASHECLDLNVGDGMLVKALAEATGRDSSKVKEDYKKAGDLGLVASQTRSRQSTIFGSVHGTLKDGTIAKLEDKPLTIAHVYQSMRSVATVSGKDSTKVRRDVIKQLLQAARGEESKFIIRIFQGKLRIGLAEASVITSIAAAVTLSPTKVLKKRGAKVPKPEEAKAMSNKAADCLKTALAQVPDYETCLGAFLNFPCEQVPDICSIRAGVPVKPMLAMPSKGVTEVLQKFENQTFTCEYKYDGERGQVHLMPDGTVKIFSRNMEDNTEKYPDLRKVVPLAIDQSISTCILDCEIVAYDREQERILPFQVLSTRARKNVEEKDVKVQVCLFVFDVLFFNGSSTVDFPLADRRDIIKKFVTEVDVRVRHVTYKDTNDPEEMQAFLVQAVEDYCEGLMVKSLEGDAAKYVPDKRSREWWKLKKDYMEGMSDTFDVVILGAWLGRGKRHGGYGAFMAACYNKETGMYESCSRLGSGFSEDQLVTLTAEMKKLVLPSKPNTFSVPSNNLNGPDVWFEPKAVWEVAAADLSLSPAHMAGSGLTGGEGRGVALRFPRFLKVRDDKQPEDATSSQQIVDMFNAQKNQQDSPKKKARDAAAASDSALVSEEESLGPSDLE